MKVILFPKCSKFYLNFKKLRNLPENVDGFEDNCV